MSTLTMDPVIRRPVLSMPKFSLDSSLDRSSKLGREVLERSKRRSVDWSSARLSKSSNAEEKQCEIREAPAVRARLDHAFAKIVECMSETTNQCKMFYSSDAGAKPSESELAHVCRFHSREAVRTSGRRSGHSRAGTAPAKQVQFTGLPHPEEFLIDVSPGTYAITAATQDAGPQTKVVRVSAGESTRLTFNL